MKIRFLIAAAASAALIPAAAHAKQAIQAWPIADVMNNPEYMADLGGVAFTWGDAVYGEAVATSRVERASRGVMRDDKEACERALVDALKEMRLHALQRGAHSVQAIKSTVTGAAYASDSDYLCMTGHTNSRVHVEGKIVMEAPPHAPVVAGQPPVAATAPQEFEQRSATPRPVSTPQVDPEQEDIYGAPWE